MSYPTIPRSRFTYKACREFVEDLNSRLSDQGCDKRMEVGSRNNYTAVDWYSQSEREVTRGYGVQGNVSCGTPRQCAEDAREFYYNAVNSG